jgi:hypothetical protein
MMIFATRWLPQTFWNGGVARLVMDNTPIAWKKWGFCNKTNYASYKIIKTKNTYTLIFKKIVERITYHRTIIQCYFHK